MAVAALPAQPGGGSSGGRRLGRTLSREISSREIAVTVARQLKWFGGQIMSQTAASAGAR